MSRMLLIAGITTTLALSGANAAVAAESESEPTNPPLGPPVVYDDPAGDVTGGPDLIACGASEPWESLVSFRLEFASEPPLSYDLETMTTDELWVAVSTKPGPLFEGDIEYALIVHGATLPQEETTGSGLYDATATDGNEVFWRVVDVEVDGSILTLTVDRKLVGDPEVLYFQTAVGSEGEDESGGYDMCPDEDEGPGEYELVG